MFSGHPQALINLSLCAMTIVKWSVTTFLIVWILTVYSNFEFSGAGKK